MQCGSLPPAPKLKCQKFRTLSAYDRRGAALRSCRCPAAIPSPPPILSVFVLKNVSGESDPPAFTSAPPPTQNALAVVVFAWVISF